MSATSSTKKREYDAEAESSGKIPAAKTACRGGVSEGQLSQEQQQPQQQQNLLTTAAEFPTESTMTKLAECVAAETDDDIVKDIKQAVLTDRDIIRFVYTSVLEGNHETLAIATKFSETEKGKQLLPPDPLKMFYYFEAIKASINAIRSVMPTVEKAWHEFLKVTHHNKTQQGFTIPGITRDFKVECAEWSKHPEETQKLFLDQGKGKTPSYVAISGSSGSGKTVSLIWLGDEYVKKSCFPGEKCVSIYLSCHPKKKKDAEGAVLPEYEDLHNYVREELNACVERAGSGLTCLDDFGVENLTGVPLVLMLDEVPRIWGHDDYKKLASELKTSFGFNKVAVLVAGTALHISVTKQPTAVLEVINIRMMPLRDEVAKEMVKHHMRRDTKQFVDELFEDISLLHHLATNQRCAELAAKELDTLLGKMKGPLPPGWCRGHASELLARVSRAYRAMNGLSGKTEKAVRALMLNALAITTLQKVYDDDPEEEKKGVNLEPDYIDWAATRDVVETGLVERTILPDSPLENDQCMVDKGCEWSMTPAITLMCVSELVPWISGVFDAPSHFELLVAVMLSVIRYTQTGKEWPVRQMQKSVPYQGNEQGALYRPNAMQANCSCLVNGPQAPYLDIMVPAYQQDSHESTEAAPQVPPIRLFLEKLRKGYEITSEAILVQCKLGEEESKEVSLDLKKEYGKMGFVRNNHSTRESPDPCPFNDEVLQKKYNSGKWLTEECYGGDKAYVMFATNKTFEKKMFENKLDLEYIVEGERSCEYAWQRLYPFLQISRPASSGSPLSSMVDRVKCEVQQTQK